MKFGKEFQQILDESKFPDEWKSSAIEYRQLKKLIKDVVSELSSMGLSPDVLHRLLTTDDDSSGTSTPLEIASNAAAGPSTAPAPQPISQRQIATEPSHVHAQQDGDDEVLEFEFESDEASPPTFGTSSTPGAGPSHGARPGVNGGSRHNIVKLASGVRRGYVRDPLLDDADVGNEGDHEGARGDTDSFGTSYSSNGGGESHPSSLHESGHNRRHSSFSRTRNFRVRLLSDTNPSSPDQTLNAGSSRGSRTQRSADNGKDEIAPHARARTEPTPIRPFGVADMLRTQYGDQEDLTPPLGASNGFQRPGSADGQCVGKSSAFGVGEHSHRRTVRRSMNQGGVRAQYVFAGDSSHPEPQLRFHLPPRPSPSSSSSRSTSPNPSGPSDSASTDDDAAGSGSGFGSHGASGEGEGEEDMEDLTTLPIPAPVPLRSHGHTRRHGGSGSLTSSPATIKAGYKSPFLVPAIGTSSPAMLSSSASKGKGTQMPIPQSPTLQRLNMVRSPIFALATGSGTGSGSPGLRTQGQGKKGSGSESGSPKMDGEGLRDFDLGEAAVDGLDEVEGDRYQISLDDGTKGSNGAVGEVEGCTETCPAHPASTSPDRRPLSVLPSVGAADAGSASPSSTAIATVAAPAEVAPAAVPQTLITPPAPRHNHTHSHHNGHANGRDIIVPLSSDRAFFDLLTAALTSLSVFHAAQQVAFRDAVEKLCRMISNSIVPQGSSVQIMPIPPVPSSSSPSPSAHSGLVTTHGIQRPPQELLSRRINKLHKKDLYAWREIFTLWIEAEIFESSAERTRGERTVEEAEKRLQAFAHEVVKRGLGDRRTFRGKKTREAWEEFLRLNVLLLDLKRFQLANINAARKILKKHDKRTALTASSGFQSLARATLSKIGADGSVSTWTFYNTSLPHVLLASLTDILLPILPSLDDYACLICTSIAFKPIRLSCQHLFCVRCLVKMQRKGQAECPLCRSPTVLLADKSSLDVQIMGVQDATRRTKLIDRFMRDWFPREVKAKQRENDEEIADEIRAEERGESPDCVVM